MNSLVVGMTEKDSQTENGMVNHSSTGNPLLDMFFSLGASRQMTDAEIVRLFSLALHSDPIRAIKCMFYNRDIRGGQGERRSFRVMLSFLAKEYHELAWAIMPLVSEYGRWDDMLCVIDTHFPYGENDVNDAISDLFYLAVTDGDVLAKKWCPREGKSGHDKANWLRKSWGMSWAEYRRFVSFSKNTVVENHMCDGDWTGIDYSKVPSKAVKLYRNAFNRHDETRFSSWIKDVVFGKEKINAGAIFPSDVVHSYFEKIM